MMVDAFLEYKKATTRKAIFHADAAEALLGDKRYAYGDVRMAQLAQANVHATLAAFYAEMGGNA